MGGYGNSVPVVPNEAIVIGTVCEYSIVSSRLLKIQPEQIIYRLTIIVDSSEDVEGMPNLVKGKEGQDITIHSKEKLPSDLFGKKVRVRVKLMGDEKGRLLWINNIDVIQK